MPELENLETDIMSTVERLIPDDSPSHDHEHILRVKNLALKIAEKEGGDPDVIEAAALLHDIGRAKESQNQIENHADWGAEKAGELLEQRDVDKEFVKKVEHCIRSHRYSRDPEPETIEAKIVSDADKLDALGALGIARTFSYGGENSMPLIKSEKKKSVLKHINERILNTREKIYTETGKEIAKERTRFVREFARRLENEANVSNVE